MINLVKNELFKIFHKKSTFIIMLIMFAFVILANVIYRFIDTQNVSYYYYESLDSANNYLDNYNEATDNIEDYVYYRALKESYILADGFEETSWQYQKAMNNYQNIAYQYYSNKYIGNFEDQDLLNLMEEMALKIKEGNWQYFINKEKIELEEELKNINFLASSESLSNKESVEYKKQIFILEEQIKLLEYRLEESVVEDGNYLDNAIKDINYSLYNIAEYQYGDEKTKNELSEIFKEYEVNKYILEKKQDTNNEQTLRAILINFFNEYNFLILVFIVMIAGALVSDEFNKGTIKSLLTLPYKRNKILLSKYIAIILSLLIGIIYMIILELVVGGIFFGFNSLSIPYVTYNIATNSIEVIGIFKYLLLLVITHLPQLILLGTLAFAISTIFNSTAFAITITFCGVIGASFINSLAYSYKIKILNYFVTTNWDFECFLFGGKSVYGVTLNQSIIVCLIYLAIMLVVSFIVFSKKDIKNI